MVLIEERRLKPDIWPETADQAESIEDIIRGVWAKKVHCWQKGSRTKPIALFSSG